MLTVKGTSLRKRLSVCIRSWSTSIRGAKSTATDKHRGAKLVDMYETGGQQISRSPHVILQSTCEDGSSLFTVKPFLAF